MSSQRDALNVSHEGRRQMMYPSRPLPSGPFSCLRHTHRLWFAQESKHEGSLFPVPFTFTHSCKHIAQRHCHLFLFTASCVVFFIFNSLCFVVVAKPQCFPQNKPRPMMWITVSWDYCHTGGKIETETTCWCGLWNLWNKKTLFVLVRSMHRNPVSRIQKKWENKK